MLVRGCCRRPGPRLGRGPAEKGRLIIPATRQNGSRLLAEIFGPAMDDVRCTTTLTGNLSIAGHERRSGLVFDPFNKRLELRDVSVAASREQDFLRWRDHLADNGDSYSKLVVYARPGAHMSWVTSGYLYEGVIRNFFADGDDAHLWVVFAEDSRSDVPRDAQHDRNLILAAERADQRCAPVAGNTQRSAKVRDAELIAELLNTGHHEVSPRLAAADIARRLHVGSHRYRILLSPGDEVVAVAAAHLDRDNRCARFVDCTTRQDERARGHMTGLMAELADDLGSSDDRWPLYGFARAEDVGLNCVYARLGYTYTGRLVNELLTASGWESLNVWCHDGGDMRCDTGGAPA